MKDFVDEFIWAAAHFWSATPASSVNFAWSANAIYTTLDGHAACAIYISWLFCLHCKAVSAKIARAPSALV
jgi:hypothetical protein